MFSDYYIPFIESPLINIIPKAQIFLRCMNHVQELDVGTGAGDGGREGGG